MFSLVMLILLSVYLYHGYLSRKIDRSKLSHSSYYEIAYGGEKKCVSEAEAILKDVGGYGRVLAGWRYYSKNGPASADVILLHETGIYILETKDYQGWISGNPDEEYWVQTLASGKYASYQNYFYNPVLKMAGCIESMREELSDMKWLPYYSLAVFGDGCELENAGLSDGNVKIILLRQLSYTVYGMIRTSRVLLSRQVIDEIYERLRTGAEREAAQIREKTKMEKKSLQT